MESFLEYVFCKLLGPPKFGSSWNCPFCDSSHGTLSVRPPKGAYPIKFKCWRCDAWGDELDILKLIFPEDTPNERRLRLSNLRGHYNLDLTSGDDLLFPLGAGVSREDEVGSDSLLEDEARGVSLYLLEEINHLSSPRKRRILEAAFLALRVCSSCNIPVSLLMNKFGDLLALQKVSNKKTPKGADRG